MANQGQQLQQLLFGEDFIGDHAGRLIRNTDFALVELVANAWDAGASRVEISWPLCPNDELSISDDGTGMTSERFLFCWNYINYNRITHQGRQVQFPAGSGDKTRIAYGCNGKGRHSMFCFNDEYWVKTWCEGFLHEFHVRKRSGEMPWEISGLVPTPKTGHGTRIFTRATRGLKDSSEIRHLLGSRFIADPQFVVSINGQPVDFEEVTATLPHHRIDVPGCGQVEIIKIQAGTGRTTKQNGLAWWVNGRLVGIPGWETLDDHLLDGRKALAKKLTFVILADILNPKEDVTPDWSAFESNDRTHTVHRAVGDFIRTSLQEELRGERKERKRDILEKHRLVIRELSPVSQKVVTSFIDDVQLHCPTLRDHDLENAASLLINMEKARSGYALLEQLSQLQPDDLDGWNAVMQEWTVDDARKVLGELKWRLELIKQLESRVEDQDADELHELQPLFEKGLWIFGAEYEAIEFRSNKAISTVIRDFFGCGVVENPRIRPDFVALPDASLGVYSCNSYDDNGEVAGCAKVAVVELKRGGSRVTSEEMNQANRYAYAIKQSGKVHEATQILCFVLGTTLADDAQRERTEGNIRIIPRPYSVVLRQAHARTFNLLEQIRSIPRVSVEDEDLTLVLSTPEQMDGLGEDQDGTSDRFGGAPVINTVLEDEKTE